MAARDAMNTAFIKAPLQHQDRRYPWTFKLSTNCTRMCCMLCPYMRPFLLLLACGGPAASHAEQPAAGNHTTVRPHPQEWAQQQIHSFQRSTQFTTCELDPVYCTSGISAYCGTARAAVPFEAAAHTWEGSPSHTAATHTVLPRVPQATPGLALTQELRARVTAAAVVCGKQRGVPHSSHSTW